MLISILVSFLLRKFVGKTCLSLTGAFLIVITILSSELPMETFFRADSGYEPPPPYRRIHYCFPFSFPFFSISHIRSTALERYWERYTIHFLTFEIAEFRLWYITRTRRWTDSSVLRIYSFFLLLNLIGAILGYQIASKREREHALKQKELTSARAGAMAGYWISKHLAVFPSALTKKHRG